VQTSERPLGCPRRQMDEQRIRDRYHGGAMDHIDRSGFDDFDRLLGLVRRTRELLDVIVGGGHLPADGVDFLADTALPHLETVHDGFRGSLRSDAAGTAELRYLLRQAAEMRSSTPDSAAERNAADEEAANDIMAGSRRERPGLRVVSAAPWSLAALAHARVVLAMLPKLPDEAVRFPGGHRTYADIPTPRGPAELADRIEELERELWRAALGRRPATGQRAASVDPAFRRTYGFFDAADHLGYRALPRIA
jgi:hypothetical protein